ncbi:MAG: efflux RND transporter periplasmic adaptor subunit [Planctomycetaceae bacterium]
MNHDFRIPVLPFAAWLLICTSTASSQPPKGDPPPAPVSVADVVEQQISETYTVVGTVMPARRSVVGSAVDGRVIEFPVVNGDAVKAGDTLARARTEMLELQLAAAEAELVVRQQELAELQNGTEPETIANLGAQMRAASALRDFTKAEYDRIASLFQQNKAATQSDVDAKLSASLAADQDYLAARALYEQAVKGPREERIAQAQARVAIQEAVVGELKEQIDRHTFVAPFDGFVVTEHTEVGQWVARGDPIAEVIQLSEVDVQVFTLEEQIRDMRVGSDVRVEVPAARESEWNGKVHRIIPQADVRSRTLPVEIRITNHIQDGIPALKSGAFARVHLPTGQQQLVMLVPKDALVLGGEEPLVYVLEPAEEGKPASVREAVVTLGISKGNSIQVTGPIRAGDRVVVRGNERLKNGQTVTVLE